MAVQDGFFYKNKPIEINPIDLNIDKTKIQEQQTTVRMPQGEAR